MIRDERESRREKTMSNNDVTETLAIHADGLLRGNANRNPMTDTEYSRLTALFQLAEELQQNMQPVKPSAAFEHSLGQELVTHAKRQFALARRLRRGVLIGAAALGSLLSLASLVGATMLVIARLRARSRAIHAPAGQA